MRILLINSVYAVGSTGKIVEDIKHYCENKGDEVLILYGRQGRNTDSAVIKVSTEIEAKVHSVLSRFTGLDFGFSPLATAKVISEIKKFCPDVVHLHCLNGHFINVFHLLKYLKVQNIPTVLTLHAEIMHTAGCEHAFECQKWIGGCYDCDRIRGCVTHYFRDDARYAYEEMRAAFFGFQNLTIVGVSTWLVNRARQSGIFKSCSAEFSTIENGLDTNVFHQMKMNDNSLKDVINLKKPVILHVTPDFNHPLKGGYYVIKLAEAHPDWTFVIVGYNGASHLPGNVIPISHTKNRAELASYYNIANITLLTSKRETFSMVCAESLACGTPVVGFKAGGPESVFAGDYARFVEYGDISGLGYAIKKILSNPPSINSAEICFRFSSDRMAEKYRECYLGTINRSVKL